MRLVQRSANEKMSADKFIHHSERNLELSSGTSQKIYAFRSNQENQNCYTSYRSGNSNQTTNANMYDSPVHHSFYRRTAMPQHFGLSTSTCHHEQMKTNSSPCTLCDFCGFNHNPGNKNNPPSAPQSLVRKPDGDPCPGNKNGDSPKKQNDPGGGGDNNGGKKPFQNRVDTIPENLAWWLFVAVIALVLGGIVFMLMCKNSGASSFVDYVNRAKGQISDCGLITNKNLLSGLLKSKVGEKKLAQSGESLPPYVQDAYNDFKKIILDRSCTEDKCPGLVNYAAFNWGGAIASIRNTKYFQSPARCRCRNSGLVCEEGSLPSKECYCSCERIKPDVIIKEGPGLTPGDCYSFSGEGQFLIKFYNPLYIFGISVRHPRKGVGSAISSAPKDFQVWGYNQTHDTNPVILGKFEYKSDQPSFQTFEVNTKEQCFNYIQFDFLNNHGNPQFTTVYKIEVHGIPEIPQ